MNLVWNARLIIVRLPFWRKSMLIPRPIFIWRIEITLEFLLKNLFNG